jgi:hypothetical protein
MRGAESITAGWMPMQRYKIAVLDDYQHVALESADWSVLRDRADIAVFQNHLADRDAVIERLLPFDVVCVMRERTPRPATSLSAFPISSSLPRPELETRRSMSSPRGITGSQWFTRGIGRTRRSN